MSKSMSPTRKNLGTLLVLTVLATLGSLGAPGSLAAAEPGGPAAKARQVQESPLFWLSDFSEVAGAHAVLIRRRDSVVYRVESAGLEPGSVFTLWFCGWNDPTVCVDGPGTCGAAVEDLAFDLDGAFCLWGGGRTVAADGTVRFSARFDINEPIGEVLFGAFTRPFAAEINLVLKSHGPLIDEREVAQRNSYDGGCTWNPCEELQVAIFAAE